MKKKSVLIAGGVVVIAAILILPRFLKPEEEHVSAPPMVRVEQPQKGDIELFSGLMGNVEPSDLVYVNPKLGGEVTEVYVKAGDMVTEGQELCKIDTKQVEGAKISLDTATVSLADAKSNLARMQVLYQSGDISAQSYEQIQNSVKMAQLQYEGAKLAYDTQIEYSTIKAPISGLIETYDVAVHDMVAQQNLICVISGEGSKAVTFAVTERLIDHVKIGDSIRIEKNGSEFFGTITEVSSMIDAATGLFKVKASVDHADALATGTSVKLYVTSEKALDAMVLPVDSIYYEGGDSFVYVYEAGVVHKVAVEVGIYDSEQIQILSGITMEDQIITSWSSELYEGAIVVTEETAASTTVQ